MKAWVLGAVVALAVWAAGCSSNSTAISVTVSGPTGTSPISTSGGYPVPPSGAVQLAATVSGITATTVYWQVCLQPGTPPTTGSKTPVTAPSDCSAASATPQCVVPTLSKPLTGYGTLTPNGLYTAPATIPSPSTVYAVATSCVNTTYFNVFQIVIESQYKITITPSTATIATGQSYQFNATVQGPQNSGVTWAVCTSNSTSSGLSCGVTGIGTISGSGLYTAPGTLPTSSVTIQATSVADTTQTGTATVNVVAATAPVLSNFSTTYPSPLAPMVAAAGSAQQDVYINGSNFLSTEEVFVGPAGQAGTAVPTLLISTTLLRATIPAAQLASAGTLQVGVQTPDGSLASTTAPFTLFPTRPALISELPSSVVQGSTNAVSVALTGGFFSSAAANATSVTFNGSALNTGVSLNSSRQLTATLQGSALQTEGLFPIVVQNAGVASGQPSMAGMNFAVTPATSSIPSGPGISIPVGTNPSAVAIDKADGWAVVANTGSNNVSIVSLATNTVVTTYTVGNQPTGVAVDDQLPDPVALVVNNADQTITAIDLHTGNAATLSVKINSGQNPPLPYAVGINSDTAQLVPGAPVVHRALVAYQSASQATVLDVSDPGGAGATPTLSIVQTIGSAGAVPFSTGQFPAVAIDPQLNWAMVTPGGSGAFGIVDLGRDAVAGVDVGRTPQILVGMTGSVTTQGIGADPETHQVLLSDPNLATGNLSVFNPLNSSVTTVTNPCTPSGSNTCTGTTFNGATFGSAAVNPLTGVGVAVAPGNAVVVNLAGGVVLQSVNLSSGAGSSAPQAVAVDPVMNEAVVVNSAQNSVSILSLGGTLNPMQIVGASPSTTFTSSTPITLTVTGSFASGSTVRLDQVAVPTAAVGTCPGSVCRQLTAAVPASMLTSARRFAVDVQAPSLAVSNIESFTVVQPVPITCISGQSPCDADPVGVAVDNDRDLAVVTNSSDGSASLISLASGSNSPLSLGPIGQLSYSPVRVGSSPAGVAVLPTAGLAIVANTGSNNVTAIDETGLNTPSTITLCGSNASAVQCISPVGVAIDRDTATAVVTNTNPSSTPVDGSLSTFALSPLATSVASAVQVDPDPVAVAVDPTLDYAAVATASQSSSVSIVNLLTQTKIGDITGTFQNPTGIIFDPLNQVFLAADSALNQIGIIDPNTFLSTQIAAGIGPTSLDYNYQTSTLVTENGPSRTMSIMSYVCPPSGSAPTCTGPQVQSVLALGGAQNSATVNGPSAVAIDRKLNLAVVVDPDNSRVLLVPLPQ